MSPVIQVSNLSKAYRIGKKLVRADSLVGLLRDTLTAPLRNFRMMRHPASAESERDKELHWALRDVSFDLQQGEVLGVIGRNGAGKSTLLKILSRISEPTSGEVKITGRVASLLEVGTGFHPELTGRENVYLNGTILGMRKKEIDRKFDEIAEFSGVEKFLDTAVKRYSSGMKVRLAFAVAAHLDPEILIIDEVLAVGDASFQKRCIERMLEISREGRTILFVSHNIDLVDRLCNRAIVLRGGGLEFKGNVHDAIAYYMAEDAQQGTVRDLTSHVRSGDGRARFVQVEIQNAEGQPCDFFSIGETVRVVMTLDVNFELMDVGIAVILSSASGNRVVTSWNREADTSFHFDQGQHRIYCEFEDLKLRPGHELWVSLWMEDTGSVVDHVESVTEIRSRAHDEASRKLSTDRAQGVIALNQRWGLDRRNPSTTKNIGVSI